ncbi:MAG: GDSL-type esterase/lipase family protein, partial [Rhodopila sp.]
MTSTAIAPPPSAAGTIGANPLVTFNWNPATQLTQFLAAEAAVQAGTNGARVKIIALGDSTTEGVGGASKDVTAYPAQMAIYLTQDGVAAQSDSFLGGALGVDNRISLVGGAVWSAPQSAAGGQMIELQNAGDGFDFKLNTPQNYDRVDIYYYDKGTGEANVSVDGGQTLATIQLGNTGQLKTQTIILPAGQHSTLSVRDVNSSQMLIEGASFWDSTDPSIEVYNAGVNGAASVTVGTGTLSGLGEIQGAAETEPTLAFINYGINDINGGIPAAQTAANLKLMIDDLRSVGCDTILVIPQPFDTPNYAAGLPALRSAVEALALAENVPVIDLSATYNNDETALSAAGLMSDDNIHPNSTLYADIASGYAALLASAVNSTAVAPVVTPSVPAPSAPLLAASSDSGVVGDGITNVTQPTFTGSAAAGDVVKLYDAAG